MEHKNNTMHQVLCIEREQESSCTETTQSFGASPRVYCQSLRTLHLETVIACLFSRCTCELTLRMQLLGREDGSRNSTDIVVVEIM